MFQEAHALQELELFLEKQVAGDAFSGCVLLTQNGLPLFQKAYGLAEKNFAAPNQLTTKFNLGSVTKTLTAIAILDLVQQDRLKLTDTVDRYVRDCPYADSITIHHLLSHTAGLGDGRQAFTDGALPRQKSSEWLTNLRTLPPSLQDLPFSSAPGERFQYSNAGYNILGLVIEAITQRGYYAWMRERLYQPLDMHDTDAYPLETVVPNLAYGYTFGEFRGPDYDLQALITSTPRIHSLPPQVPCKGEPAGGIYSTALDLSRLAEALRKQSFLQPEYTELLMSGKIEAWPGTSYSYGLTEQILAGERIVAHTGGLQGWNASFELYLQQGYTSIVLANYDPPAAELVARKIQELLIQA